MNSKRHRHSWIRGWLPKEPTLHTHQAPADPKNSLMVRWMARAIVLGAVASGVLGVFGAQTGLDQGVGGLVWSVFVAAIAPVAVAVAIFLARRKEAQHGRIGI
jgi:hypothetical protein